MPPLTFLEDTHQYFLDGAELPSVTHLTRFLSYDVAEFAKPWLRDEAAARGTAIHAACEAMDYGLDPDLPVQYLPYLDAYAAFLRDYRVHGWIGIEVQMGSTSLGFAGTADRIGSIDGETAIVDLKTGSALHTPSLTAQLTGYAMLYKKRANARPLLSTASISARTSPIPSAPFPIPPPSSMPASPSTSPSLRAVSLWCPPPSAGRLARPPPLKPPQRSVSS